MTRGSEVKEGGNTLDTKAHPRSSRSALDVVAAARSLSELPASLGSRAALELGLKPLLREMHDAERAEDAARRWRAAGLEVLLGPVVEEHVATAAAAIDPTKIHFTVRPLKTHPLVQRLVRLGGGPMRRLLLEEGRANTWLKERLGADQYPERLSRPPQRGGAAAGIRRRRVLYVSRDAAILERGRETDAMGEGEEDARVLGALLGYPPCCVAAFAALEVRYPNRVPIAAAMARTRTFEPLLNNLCLRRFTYIAHFPCRYDCPQSLAKAQRLDDALSVVNPELMAEVRRALGMPRLYESDARQAVLEGARRHRDRLHYERLVPLADAWPARAGGRGEGARFWASFAPRPGRDASPIGNPPRALARTFWPLGPAARADATSWVEAALSRW